MYGKLSQAIGYVEAVRCQAYAAATLMEAGPMPAFHPSVFAAAFATVMEAGMWEQIPMRRLTAQLL